MNDLYTTLYNSLIPKEHHNYTLPIFIPPVNFDSLQQAKKDAISLLYPFDKPKSVESKTCVQIKDDKFVIRLFRFFHPTQKEYPIFRRWLENDPRTNATTYALVLQVNITRPWGIADLIIYVEYTDKDKEALREAGLLVTEQTSLPTLACKI